MSFRYFVILLFFILLRLPTYAQDMNYAKLIVNELCAEKYKGRGYVDDGVNKAASFLANEFTNLKLKKFGNSYTQSYSFGVNTHPTPIHCKVDQKELRVGHEFLVSAGAPSCKGNFKLLHFNTKDSLDLALLSKKIKKGFTQQDALVLHQSGRKNNKIIDSLQFYHQFPGLIIFTEEKKLTHTIATDTDKYASIVIFDSVIAGKENIEISFENQWQSALENKNIIGYIKGKRTDSCIVFSAHYDHLGMQGDAMFPGASDNASGTSMICYLAAYFSKHKPPCNMVFILFSGEEAGLLGSQHFTKQPIFDIFKIKMLINIDIMGNAENGITVVNGEIFKEKFESLKSLNTVKKYIPDVKIRGKAKNSDHYYFSEKGIPSFFIYSMGGTGFYHDVFDKPATLTYTHYENVAKLLIDYVYKICL
ncbi:MAG: M28 family peptidase [Bacteroidetes bacterium]|nr:M28 family peptidase [Bacteroidota bacterium]